MLRSLGLVGTRQIVKLVGPLTAISDFEQRSKTTHSAEVSRSVIGLRGYQIGTFCQCWRIQISLLTRRTSLRIVSQLSDPWMHRSDNDTASSRAGAAVEDSSARHARPCRVGARGSIASGTPSSPNEGRRIALKLISPSRRRILSVFAAFIATAAVATSQETRGRITGQVVDSTKAAIPGASVTVTDQARGTAASATTNAEGLFQANYLLPGTYEVTVELARLQEVHPEGRGGLDQRDARPAGSRSRWAASRRRSTSPRERPRSTPPTPASG